jgi:hypothetical protein
MRIALFALVAASACAGREPAASVTVRDSAGIRIVENRRPDRPTEPWTVAEHPSVVIGGTTDDSTRQLAGPTDATRLAGGQIVVADHGAAALRFYDHRGIPVRAVGRPGSGPGEFRYLWWVQRGRGDTLFAYDGTLFRISVFDSAGRYQRSHNLPGRPGYYWRQALGLFPNGDLLIYARANGSNPRAEGPFLRVSPLFRWTPGAETFDSLGVTWSQEEYAARMGRAMLEIPTPFGRATDFAPWRDALLVGWTDAWDIQSVTGPGRVAAAFRITRSPASVSDADREAALEFLRNRSRHDQIRKTVARVSRDLPTAATMPAFGRWAWERVSSADPERPSLVVDALDYVWVLRHGAPGARRAWDVLRPDGRWLGVMSLPPGLEPLEIGTDFILGWRKDDLDLIAVELYRLERS